MARIIKWGLSPKFIAAVLLAIVPLAISCTASPTPTPSPTPNPGDELKGGVVATFDVVGFTFRVFVANPNTIEDLFRLQRGESTANIPNGSIRPGSGTGQHNLPWSWHLDPEDVHMAEFTIEL